MENGNGGERKYVLSVLPWVAGAAALVIYLLTLNHWVSLFNLTQVTRISGWMWTPELTGPAYFLITLPLRLLPAQWVPLALNLFTAVCAALTIAQLARSVALLPHDRTHEQRLREHSDFSVLTVRLAWLPPVLAVIVCGLQLSFWEHGTNGSQETFNLLLLSYVIREFLEFRMDGRDWRLYRAAFVFGASMTNNWVMVAMFPAFLAAVVWIRGISFFNIRFLGGMTLAGLIGLSLYLLLPLLATLDDTQSISFWLALKGNFLEQYRWLNFMYHSKKTIILLSLTSFLPLIILSIRWASYFGDSSKLGKELATWMFHVVHGAFLLACTWAAFDPPFSGRQKLGTASLPFYYLGALSVGYFAGYFLLVFRPKQGRFHRRSPTLNLANRVATVMLFVLLILVPVGLISKNLPEIRTANGPMVKQYAAAQVAGLPRSGIILSDDNLRLAIAQAWLARNGRATDFIPLNTQYLVHPGYHRFLQKKYPLRWPQSMDAKREQKFTPAELIRLLVQLSQSAEIWYLHPSFGYYFEFFYPEPHGLLYHLKPYGAGMIIHPAPSPEIIKENETFWAQAAESALDPVVTAVQPPAPGEPVGLRRRVFKRLHIPLDPDATAKILGSFYSRALNYWGVQMQRLNELQSAAKHFQLALDLNPDNVVAEINLDCNQRLRDGKPAAIELSKSLEDRFGQYRSFPQMRNANGPFDEPNFCYAEGYILLKAREFRQAAEPLNRVRELSPDNLPSRLLLGQIYLMVKQPDKVLAITDEIHAHPEHFQLSETNAIQIACMEASAQFLNTNATAGTRILQEATSTYPTNEPLLSLAAAIYWTYGSYTNALALIDRRLKLSPDDPNVLIQKSFVYTQMKDYPRSIQILSQVLENSPTNTTALLNRAAAYLNDGQLDEAKADYQHILELHPGAVQVSFGLAEVALRQHDTNAAVRIYQDCLTDTPTNTPAYQALDRRIKQLKGELIQ